MSFSNKLQIVLLSSRFNSRISEVIFTVIRSISIETRFSHKRRVFNIFDGVLNARKRISFVL